MARATAWVLLPMREVAGAVVGVTTNRNTGAQCRCRLEEVMSHSEKGMRVAGVWLALASIILALALVFHGPPSPDLGVQMRHIADGSCAGRSCIGLRRHR